MVGIDLDLWGEGVVKAYNDFHMYFRAHSYPYVISIWAN